MFRILPLNMKGRFAILFLWLCLPTVAAAQLEPDESTPQDSIIKGVPGVCLGVIHTYRHGYYTTNGCEAAMISSALINHSGNGGSDQQIGVPRLSMFLNIGITFNYNFTRHFGAYTGLQLKNTGFIQQNGSELVKHRVYALGVPFGLRIGGTSMHQSHLIVGGGFDLPFNYKEKRYNFLGRNEYKFNEWFSQHTPNLMPFCFVGFKASHDLIMKLVYYPGNFLNENYADAKGARPYAGYDVHMFNITVGYSLFYGGHIIKSHYSYNRRHGHHTSRHYYIYD